MMIWRVRVRCDYMEGPALPKRCYETALVEAKCSSDALDAGEKYVEDRAPGDTKWMGFTAIEAAAVELPRLVKSL